MKKLALLAIVALVVSPFVAVAGDKGELPKGQTMASISVSGMTCGGCCTKVESAVADLEGVIKIKADYEKGVAMVVYEDKKVDLDTIVEAINTKTSFKAEVAEQKSS